MTLSFMKNNILRFVPGMQPDIIESTIQDAYRQLCLKDWNRLKFVSQINTVPLYATGTITIDATGAVTGTGTNFTSSMIGRHLRFQYSDSIFEIVSVADQTHLTVDDWTGLVVTTAAKYTIMKIIYSLDPSVGVIFSVNYDTALTKKSQSYFNRFDPARWTTGTAEWWAYAGVDPLTGGHRIEIYPVPYETEPLRIYGKKRAIPLSDTTPVYSLLNEDLLEAYALVLCYRIMESKNPKQGWAEQLANHMPFYSALLDEAWAEDFELGAHMDRVRDQMSESDWPQSNDFWAAHDIE